MRNQIISEINAAKFANRNYDKSLESDLKKLML